MLKAKQNIATLQMEILKTKFITTKMAVFKQKEVILMNMMNIKIGKFKLRMTMEFQFLIVKE